SCAECRRRRIRCDGTAAPCGQCKWYRVSDSCYYPTRKQRNAVSNRSFQEISASLDRATNVLKRLFPDHDAISLDAMSSEQLLSIAQKYGIHTRSDSGNGGSLDSAQDEDIQCFEPSPREGFEFDEQATNESDDVNGLALTFDSGSSCVGISSINAILKTIALVSPSFRAMVQQKPGNELASVSHPKPGDRTDQPELPEESILIDASFTHIHFVTPLIEESTFRAKHADGKCTESPWLALLNMVLAMGSLCTPSFDDKTQLVFHKRATDHLSLQSFSTGHLETVQALALLGGYYCHHTNQPNKAFVITGSALRMAIAMGLHRESVEGSSTSGDTTVVRETRRRVWWSLFCLDSWACVLLGRPTFGRWDPHTITVNEPSSSDHAGAVLSRSIAFCKITTSIQDRFARLPLITCDEIRAFDEEAQRWETYLPLSLQLGAASSQQPQLAHLLIGMRCINLRLVLHRPRLLTSALRRSRAVHIQPEEQEIVDQCRSLACDTVDAIQDDWLFNQLALRNINWFLFQACMVLLLSICSEHEHNNCQQWIVRIEASLIMFDKMSRFCSTIRRTHNVMSITYVASKSPVS
ncbi:hypothetical protein DL98DRAFT_391074, partial [Cadophora sp. DSE1049]